MKIKRLFLIFILVLAAVLRLYKIDQYLTFLGDEGRDVLVVKRMISDGKFTLLGPITSVGSIYMGPIYYYFTAPFLWLWNFNPTGPAVMVVLFSLATVYLIYRLGNDYFDESVGLVAALLYSVSRLTIIYGRSSWNPNIVPFFAILLVFSLMRTFIDRRFKFLILAGLSLGCLIQLHYITFMFLPIILVIFLRFRGKIPLKYYFYGFISFIIAYSPFILFEIRHQFVNTQGAFRFLIKQNSTAPGLFLTSLINTLNDLIVRIFWRSLVVINAEISKLLIVTGIIIFSFFSRLITGNLKSKNALSILLIWLSVGILSFGIYRGAIYDYYFGSLFPLPFLLFGIMFYLLFRIGLPARVFAFFLLILLVIFNLVQSPLLIEPNNMLKNTKKIAGFVLDKTSDRPYNFALIATHNSDHAYRYFMEIADKPPVTIENLQVDPLRKTVAGQLMVVCEEKICQPLGHPLWEIAGFGSAEITGEWDVVTVKVFRLIPLTKKNNG